MITVCIAMSSILTKLYGIILEKKINKWLEMKGKHAKGQTSLRRNHSTTLRIIA